MCSCSPVAPLLKLRKAWRRREVTVSYPPASRAQRPLVLPASHRRTYPPPPQPTVRTLSSDVTPPSPYLSEPGNFLPLYFSDFLLLLQVKYRVTSHPSYWLSGVFSPAYRNVKMYPRAGVSESGNSSKGVPSSGQLVPGSLTSNSRVKLLVHLPRSHLSNTSKLTYDFSGRAGDNAEGRE